MKHITIWYRMTKADEVLEDSIAFMVSKEAYGLLRGQFDGGVAMVKFRLCESYIENALRNICYLMGYSKLDEWRVM